MIMGERWLILNSGPGKSAWNMALDEALLRQGPQRGAPVLRFYGWTQPAATFGYSQRIAEVQAMTPLRPLIRRCTGGGLVPHEADWTYSLVFPPQHPWFALRAEESYLRLHQWLNDAFALLSVATELAPCCAKELPGRCFAGPEKADLVWQGRKIAGAAQRRTRDGLLIQGSIQPCPVGVKRGDWEQAILQTAAGRFECEWLTLEADDELRRLTAELVDTKYGQPGHQNRR